MPQQKVLITGGASGIVLITAKAFLQTGVAVFICDKNENALASVNEKFTDVKTTVCDMAMRADVKRMLHEGTKSLGGLDVLINKG
jgi:short-subunit dehydrogenase involved in D-alanine esterification of teichoic acids